MNRDEAVKLIQDVIQDMTLEGMAIEEDATLFGVSSKLDSMDLVLMSVMVEQALEQQGYIFTLMNDKAFSQKHSPFRTIGTLADYIVAELDA